MTDKMTLDSIRKQVEEQIPRHQINCCEVPALCHTIRVLLGALEIAANSSVRPRGFELSIPTTINRWLTEASKEGR